MSDLASIFGRIYAREEWRNATSPNSGPRSSPQASQAYVQACEALCRLPDVESVLDIGQGDWKMWPSDAFSGLRYHGIDVAESLSVHLSLQ